MKTPKVALNCSFPWTKSNVMALFGATTPRLTDLIGFYPVKSIIELLNHCVRWISSSESKVSTAFKINKYNHLISNETFHLS
ncbi:hypothetical protein [Paenibacillus sp. P36]|uniref:hypothetical protein n=1 Tax=Paenibacillus sp. P36 TaxID=3342538 RepID=UPI0038B352F8